MSAVAAPRRAPARPARRRAPAQRATSRRRVAAPPPRGQLIPLAVGRTAVAMRDLPDSGVVMRMTRGRLWIGVLGGLLAGIVALNVVSLGLSSTSGRVSEEMTHLEQQNSELEARIAELKSNGRVEAMAAKLGMQVPAPGDIRYLDASGGSAITAARLLSGGAMSGSSSLASAPSSTQVTPAAATVPAAQIQAAAPQAAAPAPQSAAAAAPTSHAGGIAPG